MPVNDGAWPLTWDVIVIGAGPAGAISAILLARENLKVLLVDKADFPRHKVCGCCLSQKTLAHMKMAGLEDLINSLGGVTYSRLQLSTASGAATLDLPRGLAVSRQKLDDALVKRAMEAGAVFLAGTKATVGSTGRVNGQGEGRCVELSGPLAEPQTAWARIVLVADGINGQSLAQLESIEDPALKPVISKSSRLGAGTILAGAAADCSDYADGAIYMAVTPGAYLGLVRTEEGKLDVAGAFDRDFLRRHKTPPEAARFVLGCVGLPYPEALDQSTWSGTAPFTRKRKKIAAERLFIIGDAASYSEPFTGEGIGWATAAALQVVPKIVQGRAKWDESLMDFWQREHCELISSKQLFSQGLGLFVRSEIFANLVTSGILKNYPALARPLISYIHS